MAQDAHEAPLGRSRSTSPATGGMWESPRRMQTRAPIPSWSLPYAEGAGQALGTHLSPAAADSRPPSERVPDHAWNQSAPSTGAHGRSGYRENFLSLLEASNVTPEMFDDVPAVCDYLGGVGAATASNMAGPAAYGAGSVDRYSAAASVTPVRHEVASSPLVYSGNSTVAHGSSSVACLPCYDHEVKTDSQQQGFGAPTAALFLQQTIPSRVEIQSALGYSGMGCERLAESSFGVESLPDAGAFGDYRSAAEFMSSNSNQHGQDVIRPAMGSSSSGSGAPSVATRRKSEERVGGNTKKSKQEDSHKASPPKPQAPKVKLGEKITALQQIVSPFGKTDTASVLFETIKYIKFLHEQLQLFSEPYMTKSAYKGHIQFGGEEKEKTGTGHGLRGRGLCLVPVSLTSEVYHDDTLPDCWTLAYRSCLYR